MIKTIYRSFIPFRASKYFEIISKIFNYLPKEEMIIKAMEFIKYSGVEGDYFEFGTWDGRTFAFAYNKAKYLKLNNLNFYAFDSFEGLPEPKGIDKESTHFTKGKYQCSLEDFKKNIKKMNVDLKRVIIIKGWFNEKLNKETKSKYIKSKSASIVWIDCDLYESTVPVLEFIHSYLVDGTIMVFDDWFSFKGKSNFGEQKALNEWLKKHKDIKLIPFQNYGSGGKSFIINKITSSR